MGGSEIILILLAVLVLFGADKLPEFAKGLGKGLREVKKATDEIKNELTNNSSEIVSEIRSITDTISKDNADFTSNTLEIKNEITQAVSPEIANIQEEVQQNIETRPYHELVKRKTDELKS